MKINLREWLPTGGPLKATKKMTVYKGSKNPRQIEVCAVGCEADKLDQTLKGLNAEGWNIRQIYQEAPPYYRVFAQRDTPISDSSHPPILPGGRGR